MKFNEDSRVKIPAILHLMKFGYTYIPFKEQNRIKENNIFPIIFIPKIAEINGISEKDAERKLEEIWLRSF